MEVKKYKVRLNSTEKIEELLQEIYDQACKHIIEIQNEMSKLINATNLGAEEVTMDDKVKYSKAIHDFLGDKKKALEAKFEIAKFMGEILKHGGDVKSTLNDQNYKKRTSLNLEDIKAAIKDNDDSDDTMEYKLSKNFVKEK